MWSLKKVNQSVNQSVRHSSHLHYLTCFASLKVHFLPYLQSFLWNSFFIKATKRKTESAAELTPHLNRLVSLWCGSIAGPKGGASWDSSPSPKLKLLQTLVQTWLEIFPTALCIRQADSCKTLLSLSGLKCESECEMSRGLIGPTQRRAPQNERSGNTDLTVRGRKQERGESVFGLRSLLSLFSCYLMRNSLSPSVLFPPLILFPLSVDFKSPPSYLQISLLLRFIPVCTTLWFFRGRARSGLPERDRVFFFSLYLSSLIVFPFPSSFFL